jgi:hypothetical protein
MASIGGNRSAESKSNIEMAAAQRAAAAAARRQLCSLVAKAGGKQATAALAKRRGAQSWRWQRASARWHRKMAE